MQCCGSMWLNQNIAVYFLIIFKEKSHANNKPYGF
jgi:hypothetical protein